MRHFFLYFSWIVSLVATFSSIYFGEICGIEPCSMCWYQRICMFPLAIILGIATYKQDWQIRKYILPLIIIGFLIGFWQYLEKNIPALAQPALCSWEGECTSKEYEIFGISIPLLSALAFLIIFILLCFKPKMDRS